MFSPAKLVPIFIGTWVVLGVISYYLFYICKNAPLKRKAWPIFVIGAGSLLALFSYLMGVPINFFVIMGPFIILIMILYLRSTKFCDSCGETIMDQNFSKPEFCTECGAKLNT